MKRGFDAWEVVLCALFAFLIGVMVARPSSQRPLWTIDPDWIRHYAGRYGDEHYSAGLEEYLVRAFFDDERDGVFVDVGAFKAREGSNTYRLERDFGWSGLAIDANPEVAVDYPSLRPRTRFVAAFVADENGGTALLHVDAHDAGVSSGDRDFTEQFGDIARTIEVPKRTLDSLLSEYGVANIDFLSMDIELGEPAALRGFDLVRYRPRLVCVEVHPPTRQAVLEYFTARGYVLVGDYLGVDPLNLWFRPLPDVEAAVPKAEGQ